MSKIGRRSSSFIPHRYFLKGFEEFNKFRRERNLSGLLKSRIADSDFYLDTFMKYRKNNMLANGTTVANIDIHFYRASF